MAYIEVKSYDPIMAALYGKKPSKTDRLIGWRSDLSHTELRFSERYGRISFSATMADKCRCARFKMIGYSHPERWRTVRFWVTDEQEDAMFAKACKMADCKWLETAVVIEDVCYYGPNALKYDLLAVSFSFISKRTIWRPDKTKVFCTEAVFILLLIPFPDILSFKWPLAAENPTVRITVERTLKSDQLTPSLGDKVARNYARKVA